MLHRAKWLRAIVRSLDFRQLPHPRHERSSVRALHQKHAAVTQVQSVVNFPFLAPLWLRSHVKLSARSAEFDDRTHQTLRRPRSTHRRAQFHHGLIEVAWALAIEQVL